MPEDLLPMAKKLLSRLEVRGEGSAYRNVTMVQVKDGAEKPLTSEKWNAIETICWLPDGGGLIVTAQ